MRPHPEIESQGFLDAGLGRTNPHDPFLAEGRAWKAGAARRARQDEDDRREREHYASIPRMGEVEAAAIRRLSQERAESFALHTARMALPSTFPRAQAEIRAAG